MVLSRLDAAGQHQPEAVLCGSTNFTANGVYRQANVVHVLDDARVSASYLQTFEQVWATPADVGATREWLTEKQSDAAGAGAVRRLFTALGPGRFA